MKKLLPIIALMTLTACSSPTLSSSSEYSSSESSIATSTSEISSTSSSESSSTSSITSSITSSSSTSSISSSSSSSSSSSVIVPPTPSEIFESFHEKLALKNSTLVDENAIEQKIIDGNLLTNHYYGDYADQDDGYCVYLDQGVYHFNIVENGIEIDRCKTPNKDLDLSFFFCTTYDLLEFKNKWKKTADDFVYTSTDKDLSILIGELDNGKGSYVEFSDSFKSTLTIAEDGESAKYEVIAKNDGYGEFNMSFTVKDLGTTTHESISSYLENAPRLEVTNEFTNEIKTAITKMFGGDIDAPIGTSYAHNSYVSYDNQKPVTIFYEDFLAGDQVSAYRTYLESINFSYSDLTTEKEDLKKYGYIRYYYEKVVGSETLFVELYYKPKLQLDEYEKLIYPNGILHLRFIRPAE